jgi:hypothetical protein
MNIILSIALLLPLTVIIYNLYFFVYMRFFYTESSSSKICGACNSQEDLQRVATNKILKYTLLFGKLKRYQCLRCHTSFHTVVKNNNKSSIVPYAENSSASH